MRGITGTVYLLITLYAGLLSKLELLVAGISIIIKKLGGDQEQTIWIDEV